MSDNAAKSLPHNSSRKTALEQNDSKNFMEGPEYDVTGGHPVTKAMPSQTYKAQTMPASPDAKPMGIPAPFTIKEG